MAAECGVEIVVAPKFEIDEQVKRAVERERERCAKIAEGRAIRWREAAGHDDAPNWTASEIADMWVTVMRLIREG